MDFKHYYCKVRDYIRYDIPYGIKNVIHWFPVIWKDRHWDHYYIYAVLRQKLIFTEKTFRKYGHHVDSNKDADRIKTCILLLDRLMKDDYHAIAMKFHDQKWGEGDFNFKPCKDDPELFELDITYKNVNTTQDKVNQQKDFKRGLNQIAYLREQDKKILFELLKKHIDSWWD